MHDGRFLAIWHLGLSATSVTRSTRSPTPGTVAVVVGRKRSRAQPVPEVPDDWKPRASSREQLVDLVERLPEGPGVYVMRDRKGVIVYVGKARRLRARVRQYFNGHDTRNFVPLLGKLLGDIETVVTSNDKEALLLENTLIKRHRPRFNIKLRDDKQYLVLRLDPAAAWPRLELVRRTRADKARYFGPYHSAASARKTLRVVGRHFQLRTCTDYTLEHRTRPCLQYQIGRCPAPCVYEVDKDEYARQVHGVRLFLEGRHRELTRDLHTRMQVAADNLEFETAARLRDQLQAIETSLERQQVVSDRDRDQDIFGMYREGGQVEFVILYIRRGKLMGTRSYSQRGMELPDAEVLHGFVAAYYEEAPTYPDEVVLPLALADDDADPLMQWLTQQAGHRVTLHVPSRGARHKLVRLANRNAGSNFVTRRNHKRDAEAALARLQQRFNLSRLPRTIECYDISHIQGADTVGSMVVMIDGVPTPKRYRSFKIRGLTEGLAQEDRQNDDFASMYEVLVRRLRRGIQARDADDDDKDSGWELPDLMVIDGGKGQLGRVVAAFSDLGIELGAEGVDLVSLAKERSFGATKQTLEQLRTYRDTSDGDKTYGDFVIDRGTTSAQDGETRPERVFVPGAREAIALRPGSSEHYLLTQLRDEAHRFAITHHRKRRGKRALHSRLDDIQGVGPQAKKALLAHFGSVKAIAGATPEQLAQVRGVGPKLAQRIADAFPKVLR